MRGTVMLLLAAVLSVSESCCSKPAAVPPVQIAATDLYKAFEADEAAATQRFAEKSLVIEGDVSDVWGAGPPGAKPSITFRVDPGKMVHCSGDFPPEYMAKKGQRFSVTCPASTVRYSALNKSIQFWDCH